MKLYRVKFHYFCLPHNHENQITRYYRALDEGDVERRFSLSYPCAECPSDALPHGEMPVDFEIEEISEMTFEFSGGRLEPEIM